MKVKHKKLRQLLNSLGWSSGEFASRIGLDEEEVTALLSGEEVFGCVARKVLRFLRESSYEFIDFACGADNPYLYTFDEDEDETEFEDFYYLDYLE